MLTSKGQEAVTLFLSCCFWLRYSLLHLFCLIGFALSDLNLQLDVTPSDGLSDIHSPLATGKDEV